MKIPIFSTLEQACACVGIVPRKASRIFTVTDEADGGRHGRGAGRIRMFDDGKGGICFNWRTGAEAVFFYDFNGVKPSRAELARARAELCRQRAETERRTRHRQMEVANLAAQIVSAASDSADGHKYLRRKGLQAVPPWGGLRCIRAEVAQALIDGADIEQEDGICQRLNMGGLLIVVPLVDAEGVVWSVQLIDETGRKTFLKGGRKKGLLWCPDGALFNAKAAGAIGVAEGVATALSVNVLYGVPCVAAMDAGNLLPAAEGLWSRFCFRLAFYADRDQSRVGEEKAREAALKLQGRGARCSVCVPDFTPEMEAAYVRDTGKAPTDFNDYLALWSELND